MPKSDAQALQQGPGCKPNARNADAPTRPAEDVAQTTEMDRVQFDKLDVCSHQVVAMAHPSPVI